MSGDRTTVLFVCSGNICRSPYAAAAATARLDPERFTVASAGTVAWYGSEATDTMKAVATDRGLDLTSHRARRLGDVAQPDWVIGMELEHLMAARRAFPDLAPNRIRLLDHPHAVPDPYGRDRGVYESTADQIDRALEGFAATLVDD